MEGPQSRATRPFPRSFPLFPRGWILSLAESGMQTFEEAVRYGLDERVDLALTDEHLLAVRGDHVRPVGEHPVEAIAATHYVLARGLVEDVYHVVAVSSGDRVLRCGGCEFATHHCVVAVAAHPIVGAEAALNGIVAVPAHQGLVAS